MLLEGSFRLVDEFEFRYSARRYSVNRRCRIRSFPGAESLEAIPHQPETVGDSADMNFPGRWY